MTAPIIPAGAANLAERLAVWRTIINAKLGGGLKVKTADTPRASTTTFASDPHLVVPVLANTVYKFEVQGQYQAHASGQMKIQITLPTGATFEAGSWAYDPGTDEWGTNNSVGGSQTSPVGVVSGLIGTGANVPFRLQGAVHVGATAGDVALQWAQTVSNGTATIFRKGSSMQLTATT